MDALEVLADKMKELAGGWASYSALTALGSFALYLVGYLSLRFHLTALGVSTDLAVLDERYLFTGAKFLVYICSTIPIIALLGLVLVFVITLPYRLLPAQTRGSMRGKLLGRLDWSANPSSLAMSGIAISVFLIQFVMRQCFQFNNLLLASGLPEPGWMQRLLLSEGDGARSLYFSALVLGVIITTCLLLAARSRLEQTSRSQFLISLLTLLVVIQFLFLPVNYGVLIVDKMLPKVANLGGVEQLGEGQEAWLVWEGKEGMTYFVRGSDAGGTSRRLVTLPLKEVKKTEIVRIDPILRCVFVGRCGE